ncbi:MAG: 50S ribosomal protein L32e [archaeon]|nr:50S ribosomal protein L32e [archaeon]MCP8314332.1 50S ribosomal protein L32e [archaeon]
MVKKTTSKKKTKAKRKSKVNLKELLKLRESIDDKRPEFVRQESWRYKRLNEKWRKPKGIDSKMRLKVKGWPKIVKVGYRGPKIARGIHPSGYRDILVHNIDELKGLNPKTDAARLASGLGAKKRAELIEKAKELGIKVLNPRGIKKVKEVEA